jgi:hypothetical protein
MIFRSAGSQSRNGCIKLRRARNWTRARARIWTRSGITIARCFHELRQLPRRRGEREAQPFAFRRRRRDTCEQSRMCPSKSAGPESRANPRQQRECGDDARIFLQRAGTHTEAFGGVVGKANESEWVPETPLHERRDEPGLHDAALHFSGREAARVAVQEIARLDTWRRRARERPIPTRFTIRTDSASRRP